MTNNSIGFSDVVKSIRNADDKNKIHIKALTNFQDTELEKHCFDIEDNVENINSIILQNSKTLKGVFFTRSSSQGIKKVWSYWKQVRNFTNDLNQKENLKIHCAELLTPSSKGKNCGIRKKIEKWRFEIETAGNS